MRFLQPIRQRIHGLLTEPLEELTRAQRSLRYILDFGRYCAQELRADRAGEMAAALTYHTLFSLLPTIVLMLVILQTFVGEVEREALKQNVVDFALQWITPEDHDGTQQQLDYREGDVAHHADTSSDTAVQQPLDQEITGGPDGSEGADDTEDPKEQLSKIRAKMTQTVQDWIGKLEQINFASIGIVGVLLFLYAATKLLTMIEHSFNRIFDAPFGRPLYVRLPLYYTSITFAPLLLLAGQYVQRQMIDIVEHAAQATGQSVGWLGGLTALLTPLATTWLLLLLMYRFLPNTKVSSRAAAIGAFVGALGWIISIEFFKVYVNQQGTANIYGALALVPLFLLWLWMTWLIVLFGVEVTYTIQAMDGRRFKSMRSAEDRDVLFDPRWMIPTVAIIGRAFENGNPVRMNELQSETGLPNRAVASLIDMLTRANVVHHVEHGEPGVPAYTLARPPERIGVDELLDLSEKAAMRERNRSRLAGTTIVAQLHSAQLNAAKGTTLADVMGQDAL
jgi:membrane protein